MPTVKLTQLAADRIKPPTDKINTYWDSQCPGFGLGSHPRDAEPGSRCIGSMAGPSWRPCGTMAVIPEVGVARDLARTSMTKARSGINPVEQRREEEAAAEAAAQAEKKTFAWLVERVEQGKDGEVTKGFLAQYARRNQRASTLYETKRMLRSGHAAIWATSSFPISSAADITELLDDIAAKRQANGRICKAVRMLRRAPFRSASGRCFVGRWPRITSRSTRWLRSPKIGMGRPRPGIGP